VPSTLLDLSPLRAELSTILRRARNADGGWAYHSGKQSRIEPTCWALLALAAAEHQPPDIDVLLRWRRQGAWLADIAGAPPNFAFNALAGLTLIQSRHLLSEEIVRLLINARGVQAPPDPAVRLDGSLQAWPWVDGTFSWVEPTAWYALFLKQRLAIGPYPGAAERVRVGDRVLKDRECQGGGWNYGNSTVYNQDLRPYVPTTALALLALQNLRTDGAVERGLERLQRDITREQSAMALSLAIISLHVHGRAAEGPHEQLARLVANRTEEEAGYDIIGTAMALCALSDGGSLPFVLQVA
jgi:hypothetical protein